MIETTQEAHTALEALYAAYLSGSPEVSVWALMEAERSTWELDVSL